MKYQSNITHVEGTNSSKFFLFTLSTCMWCQKTKALLKSLGVTYSYVDIDLIEGDASDEAMADMSKYNPNVTFPTIVVNDGEKVILGFDEDQIRECLK